MNILFLDDNPVRIKMFRSVVPFADIVNTAQECIAVLQKQDEWDHVLLDHDLGGETYVDSEQKDTGMEVVRWICENNPKIKQIIVHSHNFPASRAMVETLQGRGYSAKRVPFHFKMDEEIKDTNIEGSLCKVPTSKN